MNPSVVAGHNAMRWTMTAGIHYNEEVAGGVCRHLLGTFVLLSTHARWVNVTSPMIFGASPLPVHAVL
jgi:hypothetical protein